MQEKYIVAKLSIKDHMQAYQLEPDQIKITKDFKKSVNFEREHYHAWLEEKKKT